jgi:hypothetical protein
MVKNFGLPMEHKAGTQLLKDINPGTTGSAGIYFAPFNGKLYFNANDGTHGPELVGN